MATPAPWTSYFNSARITSVPSPGAPPPILSAGSTSSTGPLPPNGNCFRQIRAPPDPGHAAWECRLRACSRRSWPVRASPSCAAVRIAFGDDAEGNAGMGHIGKGIAADNVHRQHAGNFLFHPARRVFQRPHRAVAGAGAGRRPHDGRHQHEMLWPDPGLEAARQQIARQDGAVECVGMRAFPVEDHAVAKIAHLGRERGVQVAHAIHRQPCRAGNSADARHQLAFGIIAFAGDHGAMQRQVDRIQPFGQRLVQRRFHLAPEGLEHRVIHGARRTAGIDGAGHHLPAFAFGHREKAIHLRGIAAALEDLFAAMDDKAFQPG